MAGSNKDVHILGLKFHVQTELLTTNKPTVHTVVFRSGRAVAARDREYSRAELAEKGEQTLVLELQDEVIASLMDRAQRFHDEKTGQVTASAAVAETSESETVEAPSSESVADVLCTRRMLGELRQRLNIERAEARLAPGGRIEHAARCFDWILEHRLFTELRVFEQVQFHVIRTRITGWSAAGSPPAQAEPIWAEVLEFFDHLAEINLRSDLIAFDRALLAWGISEIENRGPSAEVRDRLRELSGLDVDLDVFLAGPVSEDRELWLGALQAALDRLPTTS